MSCTNPHLPILSPSEWTWGVAFILSNATLRNMWLTEKKYFEMDGDSKSMLLGVIAKEKRRTNLSPQMSNSTFDTKLDVHTRLLKDLSDKLDATNANTHRILSELHTMREDILNKLCSVGDTLQIECVRAAVSGNEECRRGIVALKNELSSQREQGTLHMEAVMEAVSGLGTGPQLSSDLQALLSHAKHQQDSTEGGVNTNTIDKVLAMLTNMQMQMDDISDGVRHVRRLTAKVELRSNHFPPLFVIKPKPPKEMLDGGASTMSKVSNYVKGVASKGKTLLWTESRLVFLCSVKGTEVSVRLECIR